MDQLNTIITKAQSAIKADRDQATAYLQNLKLDGATTDIMLEYTASDQVPEANRQMAAI